MRELQQNTANLNSNEPKNTNTMNPELEEDRLGEPGGNQSDLWHDEEFL
jgi:hypothetical protein